MIGLRSKCRIHPMGLLLAAVPAVVVASAAPPAGSAMTPAGGAVEIEALRHEVGDLERSVDFYAAALGFAVDRREPSGDEARLRQGAFRLILVRSTAPAARPGSARLYLNMSVADLDEARAAVAAAGGRILSPSPLQSAVGPYLEVTDPSGNLVHLIDHPWDDDGGEPSAPTLFNLGLAAPTIEAVEPFLEALGFEVATRDYLPRTLVYEKRGASYLVVHPDAAADPDPGAATGALVLAVADPAALLKRLRRSGGTTASPAEGGPSGEAPIPVRGPAGVRVILQREGPAAAGEQSAVRAFERLKGLRGEWRARSTQGWDETIRFDVAARGSVVVETTRFREAPDRTMYTMYHMDGGRLMLTHFCEAMNQPRLLATAIEEDGRRVDFTFLDGTNIASRSIGHMDRAIYELIDADRFTSRWTWYEDGKESWMEEIVYERVR
jgi:predicted enzyme related to lactoylglutathione lyase